MVNSVTNVSETLQFIVDTMVEDAYLYNIVDSQIFAETPRVDFTLNLPHATRIGVDHKTEVSSVYFYSKIRGYSDLAVTLVVTVLSAHGENNSFTHHIVDYIGNLFEFEHNSKIEENYRIFINNISTDVTPTPQSERWQGTITLEAVQYTKI